MIFNNFKSERKNKEMSLEEKKSRYESELEKISKKELELKEKKKELKNKIKNVENEIQLKKGEKVLSIFHSNFGDITEESIEVFETTLKGKTASPKNQDDTEYTL